MTNQNKDRPGGETVEVAIAVSKIASTTQHALTILEKIGPALSRIIGEPLEQISGIVTDKLKYVRWERSVRLVDRANDFMTQRGSQLIHRPVPLNVAIPLLEAASLEEDDDLQDLWARLLVNAADASSGIEVRRGLVSILQDFSKMEARLLQAIYDAPMPSGAVPTKGLPDTYVEPGEEEEDPGLPEESVQVGLWQLMRLGCISEAGTWDSLAGIKRVRITALGKALFEACSLPPKKN